MDTDSGCPVQMDSACLGGTHKVVRQEIHYMPQSFALLFSQDFRSVRRKTLPLDVLGMDLTNSSPEIRLYGAVRSDTYCMNHRLVRASQSLTTSTHFQDISFKHHCTIVIIFFAIYELFCGFPQNDKSKRNLAICIQRVKCAFKKGTRLTQL